MASTSRFIGVCLGTAALIGMACASGVANAEGDPAEFHQSSGDISVPAGDELLSRDDPGVLAGQRVGSLVTPKGPKPTDGTLVGLENGIVGVTGSPVGGYTLYLVSDVESTKVLEEARADLPAKAADMIRVRTTQLKRAELAAAWKTMVIDERAKLAQLGSYVLDVDPVSEKIVLTLGHVGPRRASLAAELSTELPRLVEMSMESDSEGGFFRASRGSDSAPHWGGAGIANGSDVCTAGFSVVRNDNGQKASLTAGHCGSSNANGGSWDSGSHFYGNKNHAYGFPDYDQARLVGSTYANTIYTDGGSDSVYAREITDANDPAIGGMVCLTGISTGTPCQIEITSVTASACDSSGCTTYLAKGHRSDGAVIVRPGDSGGPMFHRWANANAGARGTIVGGDNGGRNVYAERWNSIKNHLNVSILTN